MTAGYEHLRAQYVLHLERGIRQHASFGDLYMLRAVLAQRAETFICSIFEGNYCQVSADGRPDRAPQDKLKRMTPQQRAKYKEKQEKLQMKRQMNRRVVKA